MNLQENREWVKATLARLYDPDAPQMPPQDEQALTRKLTAALERMHPLQASAYIARAAIQSHRARRKDSR